MLALPTSPAQFSQATWDDVRPWYDRLAEAPVAAGEGEAWLEAWSRLEELLGEAGTQALIDYTCDTTDAAKEAAYLRWSADIGPKAHEQAVRLARRALTLGLTRDDLATTLREFRTDDEIFREANVPRMGEIEELSAAYQKVTGGLSVDWDGTPKTIPQLGPFLQDTNRAVRERAFRKGAEAYLAVRDELATQFDQMYALRVAVAREAGFADYQAYTFRAKYRFDYTAADCARFHAGVEATVVPAVKRLHEYRRRQLGVDTLRPWDLGVDPLNRPALKPFANTDEFTGAAERVFARVDPELGARFARMRRERLLDLESRPGKAPGGYCTKYPWTKVPFIFMNAVGVGDDVTTLLHEAGHCFHDFESSSLPFIWQRGTGSEMAELASMSMELLAAPHLARPTGWYSEADARRARAEHLEDVLISLAHIACVDAFQAWIYTSGQGHDAAARDAAWLEIRSRFEQGVDWRGLERERVARWYRQLHIFELPFYYIEYGLAQFGALGVWRQSLRDPAGAVARYRQALALGGTRSLPELYRAAGVELVFDASAMAPIVAEVERAIEALRDGDPHAP
ncbi:MAG: M3 family oligoendopeptidase [Gemmatimonadetes bacterium]|nr:M3 family oligoendopeptidase [Gemmatimonadota bacterium]